MLTMECQVKKRKHLDSLQIIPVSPAPVDVHWIESRQSPVTSGCQSFLNKGSSGSVHPSFLTTFFPWLRCHILPALFLPHRQPMLCLLLAFPSLPDVWMLTFPRACLVLGPFSCRLHSVQWLWLPSRRCPNLDPRPGPPIWTLDFHVQLPPQRHPVEI